MSGAPCASKSASRDRATLRSGRGRRCRRRGQEATSRGTARLPAQQAGAVRGSPRAGGQEKHRRTYEIPDPTSHRPMLQGGLENLRLWRSLAERPEGQAVVNFSTPPPGPLIVEETHLLRGITRRRVTAFDRPAAPTSRRGKGESLLPAGRSVPFAARRRVNRVPIVRPPPHSACLRAGLRDVHRLARTKLGYELYSSYQGTRVVSP